MYRVQSLVNSRVIQGSFGMRNPASPHTHPVFSVHKEKTLMRCLVETKRARFELNGERAVPVLILVIRIDHYNDGHDGL